jgi:hypothetical protein
MKRSISVRCFTFLAAPLMVEREARGGGLSEVLYLPCCTSHGQETERQEEEAWKRSAPVVAAAPEEGEDRLGAGLMNRR